MLTGNKKMIKFTMVFEEAEEGGYTCWIEEMPEVISEGSNLDEAKQNLFDALNLMMEFRREEAEKDLQKRKVVGYKKEEIQWAANSN